MFLQIGFKILDSSENSLFGMEEGQRIEGFKDQKQFVKLYEYPKTDKKLQSEIPIVVLEVSVVPEWH